DSARTTGEIAGASGGHQPLTALEVARKNRRCEMLAPVYGWFTEGFDTPDLQDAKALLEWPVSTPRAAGEMLRRRSGE
ncbi:MAG TPA: hypothetical protein VEX11_02590, partial [Acetobacteraceae bacterium]|nr:hypothetical protein [Acetobacteraceae bacterium]